jgi:hypothetical protein
MVGLREALSVTTILDIKTRTGTGLSEEIRKAEKEIGPCYLMVRDNTIATRLKGLGWDVRIYENLERDQVYIVPVGSD